MAERERQLMWKKDDMPEPSPSPRPEAAAVNRSAAPAAAGERATIGRSITINGEVTGDEDLLIQGQVDGSVNLKQHSLTIGPEGKVKANVTARVAVIEGSVEGNVQADEQVVLRSTARVQGDITAPRVVLEDGARFRGGVDMGEPLDRAGRSAPARPGNQASTSGSKAASSGEGAAAGASVSAAPH